MERTTSEEVLLQLMSETNFPIYLYEIELVDRGIATFDGSVGVDTTKTWITHEWQTSSAFLIDGNDSIFEVSDNSENTITVTAGNPRSGEYSLHRWFYLTSHVDTLNMDTGVLLPIQFGTESLNGLPKYYLPFPISHQTLFDYELGQFPSITVALMNPGMKMLEDYYELKAADLNFYSHFERYNALRGNRVNILIVFLDNSGEIITPDTVKLANQFVVTSSYLTKNQISLTLASLGSLSQKKIPYRTFSKITCDYRYGSDKCGYIRNIELEDPIQKCNKLYRSYVLGTQATRIIYNEADENYYLPDVIIDDWTVDEQGQIHDSIIENTQSNYLWRVRNEYLSASNLYFDAYSYQNSLELHDYLSGGEGYINLLDKECCMGHNDSGWKSIYSPFSGLVEANPFCRPNDLIFNGDFGGYDYIFTGASAAWYTSPSSAAFSVMGGYLLADTRNTDTHYYIMQPIYNIDHVQHNIDLQKGKQLAFIMKYYGWSANTSASSISYVLLAYGDGAEGYCWNSAEELWQPSETVFNTIYLREYAYRLCDNTNTPAINRFDYIQCDTYIERIYLTMDIDLKYMYLYLRFGNGVWEGGNRSFVAVRDVSLQLYNQNERFGAFPAIPTSRYWYF